ncbi:MAG: DUF4304 domain-containing protein [Saprospiraceae bacterium]|nr:DUF4304 domain-containing protein [Saprospiraceae bacterium]
MQEIFKKTLNDTIKPLLKNAGFQKKSLTFYRKRNDLTEVINLQRSKWIS